MKKARKKRIVRRKRRVSERRAMQIKRGLMKRAKKLHLGAKRTGAYVYGTLRRIVGNPYTADQRRRIVEAINECNAYIRKESARRADIRPREAQEHLDFCKAHKQKLLKMIGYDVASRMVGKNPLSYHVGGLSSLGAKRESQRRMRTYNQIKKSIQRGNASYGELAVLQSLAKEHPKLFAGDPMMAEAGGISEAQFRRLRGNPKTRASRPYRHGHLGYAYSQQYEQEHLTKARPIPGRFYRVYFSDPQRGETTALIFKGEQLLKLSISDLSRYWPMREGLKMTKAHFRGPYDSWNEAFMDK